LSDFNIKELEAYLVVPALAVAYLLVSPRGWITRIWQLLAGGMALLVVSFAWITAVDLTPAAQRPYVSDSGTNSEVSLALGYNGIGRLARVTPLIGV
jgi:4-amino-4-deoxy-L-arabinose transferase-like glycosyltransferase